MRSIAGAAALAAVVMGLSLTGCKQPKEAVVPPAEHGADAAAGRKAEVEKGDGSQTLGPPAAGGGASAPTSATTGGGKVVTTKSGLKYEDIKVGSGPSPTIGQTVVVHYTGTLENGTKFDSSRDRGEPASFQLGQVIEGWNEGLQTMKAGGRRKLIVPPDLGYGPSGTPDGTIPPNATLLFDVELLEVR